ncbi:MAG: hypothetical protein AAGA17_02890 [Actinomycetota bacterium]
MRRLQYLFLRPVDDDAGQTTAEYALVIAAAATVVGAMIAWVGVGADSPIANLFDSVVQNLIDAINGGG